MNQNKTYCHVCEKELEYLMQIFCSEECRDIYWNHPTKIEISSSCPKCKNQFKRTVFSVELVSVLDCCPNCSTETIVLNTIWW